MEIYELTVHELLAKLEKQEITKEEILSSYTKRIEEKEKDVQAFITITTNEASDTKSRRNRKTCRYSNRNKR
jgi:Asp-tRNA(Asn)/Glu-tRNA(Gln) amidotransferase A subunit family amidase